MSRRPLREGKTQGGVKDPPDGPRPETGGPPAQYPKRYPRTHEPDIVDLRESIQYLQDHGGTLRVRKDKHARYQLEIPGLVSVQYASFYKTCKEFVKIMAKHKAGLL